MSSPNSKLPNLGTKTEEFITELEEQYNEPIYKMAPQDARTFLENLQKKNYKNIKANTTDTKIFENGTNIDIRIVRPQNNKEKLPAILYIHGGGWILGSKNTHDMLIKNLANLTKTAIIFPEYSKSPEAKYPVAMNEIYTVLKYIYENPEELNIDKTKIAIAGDSVGGNMATVTALRAKNQNGPKIAAQCLLYPVTSADMDTQSYNDFKDGPWLTKEAMNWFWNAYISDKNDLKDPYVSPLNADTEDLGGMPDTLIITDENDVLRDEGEAYAQKLDMAGVNVLNIRTNGTIHDFLMLNALSETPQATGALMIVSEFLKKYLK